MRKVMAAVIQMDSQNQTEENLRQAAAWIGEAAKKGAKLVALPETVNYIGDDPQGAAEEIPGGASYCLFSSLALKYGIWLHAGSITEKRERGLPCNTTMVFNPKGELAAVYRKLHPFDVEIQNGPSVRESDRICPGDRIVTVDTETAGVLGLGICYDLRFCEQFRLMALEGAQVFILPADFTARTGRDHWEVLLRARAIENGCYVLAPGQIGRKPNYESYGRSMIVDPWGNVLARAGDAPGVALAELDFDYQRRIRQQLQTLENRRADLYRLERKTEA